MNVDEGWVASANSELATLKKEQVSFQHIRSLICMLTKIHAKPSSGGALPPPGTLNNFVHHPDSRRAARSLSLGAGGSSIWTLPLGAIGAGGVRCSVTTRTGARVGGLFRFAKPACRFLRLSEPA